MKSVFVSSVVLLFLLPMFALANGKMHRITEWPSMDELMQAVTMRTHVELPGAEEVVGVGTQVRAAQGLEAIGYHLQKAKIISFSPRFIKSCNTDFIFNDQVLSKVDYEIYNHEGEGQGISGMTALVKENGQTQAPVDVRVVEVPVRSAKQIGEVSVAELSEQAHVAEQIAKKLINLDHLSDKLKTALSSAEGTIFKMYELRPVATYVSTANVTIIVEIQNVRDRSEIASVAISEIAMLECI